MDPTRTKLEMQPEATELKCQFIFVLRNKKEVISRILRLIGGVLLINKMEILCYSLTRFNYLDPQNVSFLFVCLFVLKCYPCYSQEWQNDLFVI